jgi:subtilisin
MMTHRHALLGFLGLLWLVPACGSEPTSSGTAQRSLKSHKLPYIVVLHNLPGAHPRDFAKHKKVKPGRIFRHALKGFSVLLNIHQVAVLRADPSVQFVQEDRLMHATELRSTGVFRIDLDLSVDADINDDGGSVPVGIAILDTGIDTSHPDLNVVGGTHFWTHQVGQSWVRTQDSDYNDDNGHGTHVAGIAAARDNDSWAVGVAPGAPLYAVKVLGSDGLGYISDVLAGVEWVTSQVASIKVANLSLSAPGSDDGQCGATGDALHMAICNSVQAGVTYVVAAGNDSDDASNYVPAAYDEVITVSALADFDGLVGGEGVLSLDFGSCVEDVDDSFACFSNYGPDVDIMAPGVRIFSAWYNVDNSSGWYYNQVSGTSQAAPHVAGAAALHISRNPSDSPAEVKAALLAKGDYAPCATPSGVCADDPDSIQEPLLYMGWGYDSFEDYTVGDSPPASFIASASGSGAAVVSNVTASEGGQSLKLGIIEDTGFPTTEISDYVQFQFCLNGPADDYLKVSFSTRHTEFASWDALGVSSLSGWNYWWWVRDNGTVFDDTTFATLDLDTWYDVEIVIDQAADTGTITVDDIDGGDVVVHTVALSTTWPYTAADADLECILVLVHGRDAVHDMYIDDAYIRGRP